MTDFEVVHNRIKKGKKWDYHKDAYATALPSDILKTLKDNALKYTRKRKTIYDK